MKRFSFESVRVLWRRVCAGIQTCLGWRDAPEWQAPTVAIPDELEPFAARAAELREAAVRQMFGHLSATAGGASAKVRYTARLTGTNATAIELLSSLASERRAGHARRELVAREDVIEFVRETTRSPRSRHESR